MPKKPFSDEQIVFRLWTGRFVSRKKFSVVVGWLALSRNSSGTTLLQETS
ncbi:hypothetical protein [Ruegeria arenilitoris]|nr:hypothetical protein [Ruegeria arenilitoris]